MIKELNIELGMPMPEMPHAVPMNGPEESRKQYPTLYLTSDKELDLGKSGRITLEFKKVSSNEREDRDGKEAYSCDLEITKIVSVEPDAGEDKSGTKETEDALDTLAREKRKKKMSDEDDYEEND